MEILHPISPIQQQHQNDCWAASSAMILGLRGQAGVREIRRRTRGLPLVQTRGFRGSLSSDNVPLLAAMLHLRHENLMHRGNQLKAEILAGALQNGCVAAFGYYHYPREPRPKPHTEVIYGLDSTANTEDDPYIYYVNPVHGLRQRHQLSFFRSFEGVEINFLMYL
jgi:hypothetical protein